ncbi:MAG: hypothetical protein K9G62_08940 [Alphaproteobacteria bacterium]|nr:hypothetical protein [Alphaproteobacteria bacterium]
MPKKIITLLFLIALITGGAYALSTALPRQLHLHAAENLKKMGFTEATLPAPSARSLTRITYENVALDPDKLSTIKTLTLSCNPFFFPFTHMFSHVEISGLSLTGETGEEGNITLSGWDKKSFSSSPKETFFRSLDIRKSRLSLLSKSLGGLSVDFELQAHARHDKIDFQGQINSKQKKLIFISDLSGDLDPRSGKWRANMQIEQGKLETPELKATRLSGAVRMDGSGLAKPHIFAEFQAGGLTIYGFPWQNAAGTFEGAPDDFKILTDAKSIGFEGLELSIALRRKGREGVARGSISSRNLSALLAMFESHKLNLLPPGMEWPEEIGSSQNIAMDFLARDTRYLNYIIRNDGKFADINGRINLLYLR